MSHLIHRISIKIIPPVIVILFLTGSSGMATEQSQATFNSIPIESKAIETVVDWVIRELMVACHAPGVVISVVHDGSIIFAKGYGYADLEKKIPMHPDSTVVRIASVSKLFTATAVMQLAEAGRLDMHRNVNDYLPDWKIADTLAEPISLAHLLTHSAGFDDRYIDKSARSQAEQIALGPFLQKYLPPRILPPGEVYTYSNFSNALAGYIVEVVAEKDFAEYVRQHILLPLEMGHSGYRLTPALQRNLYTGYSYRSGGYQAHAFDFLNDYPGGQMLSTAADMANFMIMHLQKGKFKNRQILGEAYAEKMQQPQFSHHPPLHSASGYAFYIGKYRDDILIGHNGGYIGISTRLWLFPDRNLGLFMACNTGNNTIINEVSYRLLDRLIPPAAADTTAYPLTQLPDYDRQVDRFTGFYRFSRYAHGSLEKMGVLMSMSGADLRLRKNDEGMLLMFDHRGKERRLIQVEPLLFRSIDDSYYMAFRQDERGRITHLFTDGTSALEKIGWTATLQVNRAFFAFAQTIFFLIVISYLWRRLRHKPYQGDHPALGKWQDRSRALMSAAFLLYPLTFAGVTALMVPEHELMVGFAYGVPKALYIVQSLPLFGIIFLLIFTACTLLGRRKQSGSFARFLWAIVVMTTGFAFVCWLHYWNLLGWRF